MLADFEIGRRVELARHHAHLTQNEVAKELGLTTVMISRYERGINIISPQNLQKLAKVLDQPVSYFFGEIKAEIVQEDVNLLKYEKNHSNFSHASTFIIPYLGELFSMNILDQIKQASLTYSLNSNLIGRSQKCFAVKTQNISTFDSDIAIDTIIIVDISQMPINGDKVILFSKNDVLIRNYFRINGKVTCPSANPILNKNSIELKNIEVVGVIVSIEKYS